jgi:predicted nucleotidyltransferase
VAERPGVLEVWPFGSLARGDAMPRSDADLLIIVDRDDRRPMDRAPDFLRLLAGVGRPVDVIVATAHEWRARGAGFTLKSRPGDFACTPDSRDCGGRRPASSWL